MAAPTSSWVWSSRARVSGRLLLLESPLISPTSPPPPPPPPPLVKLPTLPPSKDTGPVPRMTRSQRPQSRSELACKLRWGWEGRPHHHWTRQRKDRHRPLQMLRKWKWRAQQLWTRVKRKRMKKWKESNYLFTASTNLFSCLQRPVKQLQLLPPPPPPPPCPPP